jgi:hypothetical protein
MKESGSKQVIELRSGEKNHWPVVQPEIRGIQAALYGSPLLNFRL